MVSQRFLRKEIELNPNTTDEASVAKAETGEVNKVLQRLWINRLEEAGLREKVTAINRQVHLLLREKKELTQRLRVEANSQ